MSTPQTQVPLPGAPQPAPATSNDGSILIQTEDGQQVALRDPVKTVGHGDDERELRPLTPEEKTKRRFVRNIAFWVVCAIILLATLVIMMVIGPL